MALFENSWETLDKARNPDLYETQKMEDGTEVTFLKGSDSEQRKEATKQVFTEEEKENIARAEEQMNDRDD
jgi:hypothetical protein